jgi:large subunit ribosomal protein L29
LKIEEIRNLSAEELELRLEDALEELHNLRFQHSTHQLDNPLRIRIARRDVARLKTLLHQKELEGKG